MSIFGSIRDAIFGRSETAAPGAPAGPRSNDMKPAPVQTVDVDAVLAAAAAKKGQPSNYKVSIVDLMKLLDLDSRLGNRKKLATELGYSGAKDGSAEMNIWLHRAVMQKLAAHGGKVSSDLKTSTA